MNSKIQHPNFLCIGLEKAGTSWLYQNLKQHPQVFLPPVKEIRFFWERFFLSDQNLAKRLTGSHWHYVLFQKYLRNRLRFYLKNGGRLFLMEREILERLIWDLKYLFFPHTERWYSSLFKVEEYKITGDITPLYFQLPEEEIHRISKSFPDLKIIILLRNPIDRAWSKAKMNLCKHRSREFEEVKAEEFYSHFDEVFDNLSSYTALICLWEKYFPQENVHVNFYDKLVQAPLTFLTDICNFLNIEVSHIPDSVRENLSNRVNQGLDISIPKEYLNHLVKLYSNCIEETYRYYELSSNEPYPRGWKEIRRS